MRTQNICIRERERERYSTLTFPELSKKPDKGYSFPDILHARKSEGVIDIMRSQYDYRYAKALAVNSDSESLTRSAHTALERRFPLSFTKPRFPRSLFPVECQPQRRTMKTRHRWRERRSGRKRPIGCLECQRLSDAAGARRR